MEHVDRQVYGPWALVTGASSGIGEQFARQLAGSGINVALLARREDRLTAIADDLAARHRVATRTIVADLSQDGIIGRIAAATDDLDIGLLVSNAGTGAPGPFVKVPHTRLRAMVQLNVIAHLDLAHHFGQRLAQRGHGGIVLVSAGAAAGGLPYMANDSACKAYSLNLGEALHVELRDAGVDVTVLVPIIVDTPVVARMGIDRATLPVQPISAEQAVDQALVALKNHQPTTITRADMATALTGMKAGVVEAIQARLAAAQPAH